MFTYTRIARPEEEHGVSTPAEYARLLVTHRLALQRRRPSTHLRWPEPRLVLGTTPIIRQGRWLIACPCGNYPVYDPMWQLAVCLDCAVIYRCAPPTNWAEVEATLMRRPNVTTRNMEIGESLVDLRRENDAHGLGEGA